MNSNPTSTPSKRPTDSTKFNASDENLSRPPSNHTQELLKQAVGHELEGHTWQFDATTIAKMLSPKTRKSRFDPDHVDKLEDYENFVIDNIDIKAPKWTKLPTSKSEHEHYRPLCEFLNNCVAACHKSLRHLKGKYYDDLKFIVWDLPTADGVAGARALKPDLAGGQGLLDKDITKAAGLYWRPPGSIGYELLIPVEVKNGWQELVRQAGTYARCLYSASPFRQFAMVLGYNHTKREFRFLIFHRGGLTSSVALSPNMHEGQQDILRIFAAILLWETRADAGFPMWCNDGEMNLPAGDKGTRVQVKKVLHNTLCVRGRAPRVILVTPPTSPQDALIPVAQSVCLGPPRRSKRLKAKQTNPASASELPALEEGVVVHHASGARSGAKTTDVPGSQNSPKDDNEKPAALIAIPQNDDKHPIQYINQDIFQGPSVIGKDSSLPLSGAVVKFSWVSIASRSIEPDLLRDCSGLFGTLKHYYSFLAYHGDNSPATNHLFLPPPDADLGSCHWALFEPTPSANPEYRALWGYVSAYAGHSLVTANSPKALIQAAFHACLGWFNMIQKGYQHRDISIGNIVMVDEAVKTKSSSQRRTRMRMLR